ncbi:histidine kinase dimerization/phospho-acceptor domain-containing protein [Brevibacillus fulvus]|uniref:histidine kinase n=1 Tax=Brevibacillus fulvus TaxID=1125967 RepID=A0A938XUE1_9BACL|nr:histidine kinase dimerization/phospho-acceptor domain-containing protein [Brevibacillus fulvus]MBM7590648.1 PAS domain S-box-containing protein [Brevibacillus fulvus]
MRVTETDKQAEELELFHFILTHAQEFFCLCTAQGDITYISPSLYHLLGYQPDEMIHHSLFELIHSADEIPLGRLAVVEPFQCRLLHKNGTPIWMELQVKPYRVQNGKPVAYLLIGRDIREQKISEELILQTEKLSVAGQFAAGIAHEIRNPLTALKGFLQLLEKGTEDKTLYYEIMKAELERIESILNELLILARPMKCRFSHKIFTSCSSKWSPCCCHRRCCTMSKLKPNFNRSRCWSIVTRTRSSKYLSTC